MPIVERGEVRLYYAVYGSGRPLVFLHGAGGNSLVWWQQIDVFARHYQCIFIDARGFGRSAGPLPVPWTDAFVPDLALVLDEVGAAECALVGHSMGGWTATAFCRADPARVKTVVMSASTGGFWPPARQAERPAVRRRGEEMHAAWRAGRGPHPALGERIYREQPALARLYELLGGLNAPRPPQYVDVDRLDLPAGALFIAGEEDVVPHAVIADIAATMPGSRLVVIPQTGHSTYFERADAFNAAVGDFLAAQDPPAGPRGSAGARRRG